MAKLNVIFGPCGAGKTTYARAFARREKAVAFILDDWGVRLFGPDAPEPLEFGWMMERITRCNQVIWATALDAVAAGATVILDIGMMRRADRARAREIAKGASLDLQFHFVDAPAEVRRARVAERNLTKGESFAMDVTPEMFDLIEGMYEAPEPDELAGVVISRSE
jgi:predicted kinase